MFFKREKTWLFFVLLINIALINCDAMLAAVSAQEQDGRKVVAGAVFKQTPEMAETEEKALAFVFPLAEIQMDSSVYAIIFSRDGKYLISGEKNGSLRLWDVESRYSTVYTLEGHNKEVYSLDVSADGKYLASAGADQIIKVWDINSKKLSATVRDYCGTITALKFSPDNSVLASATLQNIIEFWSCDKDAFYHVTTFEGHKESIYALSFYPNSTYLASAGKDKGIRIWPLGIDAKIKVINDHTHLVLDVEFSPKGNFFASGGADNIVYLWRTAIEKRKLVFLKDGPQLAYIHKGWVTKVGFSPDEKFFVSGDQQGELHIWKLPQAELVKIIPVFSKEAILDFAFSADGRYLAVAGKAGSIYVYDWQTIGF